MYRVKITRNVSNEVTEITNVIEDGVMSEMPHRFFVDAEGTRHEVPFADTSFEFSKERTDLIRANLKREAEERAKQEQAKEAQET